MGVESTRADQKSQVEDVEQGKVGEAGAAARSEELLIAQDPLGAVD